MTELIMGTNHVGFTVGDLDRAVTMFEQVFGYTLVSRAPRPGANVSRLTGIAGAEIVVAHLRRPGLVGVELITYSAPADAVQLAGRPCDVGYAHLTFDTRDIAAVVAAGAAYGLLPLGEEIRSVAGPNTGARAIYLRDPDGISIELIQPAGAGFDPSFHYLPPPGGGGAERDGEGGPRNGR